MANGSPSALGLGGALDLRDFVDRIQLERLDFKLVDSQDPILPHPHPDAAAPGSVETGVGGRPAPATSSSAAPSMPRRWAVWTPARSGIRGAGKAQILET